MGPGAGLTFEQQKELLLLRMKLETEEEVAVQKMCQWIEMCVFIWEDETGNQTGKDLAAILGWWTDNLAVPSGTLERSDMMAIRG